MDIGKIKDTKRKPRSEGDQIRHQLSTPSSRNMRLSEEVRPSRSRSRLESRGYRSRSRSPIRPVERETTNYRRNEGSHCRSHERDECRTPRHDRAGHPVRISVEHEEAEKNDARDRSLQDYERELVQQRDRLHELEKALERERSRRHRSHSRQRRPSVLQPQEQRSDRDCNAGATSTRRSRSRSPTFTSRDIDNIINSLKSHPPSVGTSLTSHNTTNHKNILPDFNPSMKNQRTDIWINKVNECATVYGWDERTIIHFAMQKLQGLAKIWYESQNSILFSWPEWQQKILSAFPCDQNYGQSLEEMLRRRSKYNEPLEVYYYEKLALLNQCDIVGKRAVDCLIHGLSDKTMKSSANALRCEQPDQLLQFLMSNQDASTSSDQFRAQNRLNPGASHVSRRLPSNRVNAPLACFNCKEMGHPYLRCPKPLIQCSKCNRFGHKVDTCNFKNDSPFERNKTVAAPKTMRITASDSNSKFIKDATINGVAVKSFVDFGSEVSLIGRSTAQTLGLVWTDGLLPIKGFGNEVVYTLGNVDINLKLDDVSAKVPCMVVEDRLLEVPLLVGQTFTEQQHIEVFKNASELRFYDINVEGIYPTVEQRTDWGLTVSVTSNLEIFGPVTIRAHIDSISYGHVLIDDKIIGPPYQQLMVNGGVYQVRDGLINIDVTPVSKRVFLQGGVVIARGIRVQVVNRIELSTINISKSPIEDIDVGKVRIGETVDVSHKQQLIALLQKYKHCFASTLNTLGCTNAAEMEIELSNRRPVVYRPYRLSHKEREHVRDMVTEMLDAGIVRESTSEYSSPIILVRKKDGGLRMCVDYRMLNSVTVKERYPMPVIDDEIARLSGQAFFTSLDLTSGYYQVPISENSKPLTAFVTPDGQYEFNRMPFGLANAPAVFQRMINKVLGAARFSEATAYIDDVLIYGRTMDECLQRLEKVLKLIEGANLTLNLSKCCFLEDKINYLGYEISSLGVRPGDRKTQSVMDFPRPSNQHAVRQFLGLVGYFRKFISNFAILSHPLNKLLKKDVTWVWQDEQEKAFNELKNRLINRPILAIYDPMAQTELHTDASKIGIGGILLQRTHEKDSFKPVAFYSRQTSPEEKNFHAYELETLAVICSLKKFRVYLLGKVFKVVTDCSALRSTFLKRDLIPRIARWWLLLQEYQCTVEYRAGSKMSHVDALSRNPVGGIEDQTDFDQCPSVLTISSADWLVTLQLGDSELRRIRDVLSSDLDEDGLRYVKQNYLIRDNKLYRCLDGDQSKLRWVVPKGARWQILQKNHDEMGHFGVEKTLERIRGTYWFPKMSRFVKKYVQACIECAYAKKCTNKVGHLHPITKVDVPFHTLHVDHLGPFVRSKRGNSYLLVAVDAFTKFVFIRPVRNTKTQTTIRSLEDIFYIFRNPDRIISDRGTSFTSHAFKRFCLDKGIKHILNAVASPRSNGQVERYNRTILDSLRAQNLNYDEKDWDNKVGTIQWGLNNTQQKTIGKTPSEVMFGSSMKAEIDPRLNEVVTETREDTDLATIRDTAKNNIDAEQYKQKQRHDKGRRPARVYQEGDLVKITKTSLNNDGKSKKLLPSYVGPYRVVRVLGNDRYRVAGIPGLTNKENKRMTTVAAERMSPWVHIAALELDSDTDESGEPVDAEEYD